MRNIIQKKHEDNKRTIDSAVARVKGAVRVASATVDETMEIKDEALHEVNTLKTKSNAKVESHAIKEIKTDTKVLGKKKLRR